MIFHSCFLSFLHFSCYYSFFLLIVVIIIIITIINPAEGELIIKKFESSMSESFDFKTLVGFPYSLPVEWIWECNSEEVHKKSLSGPASSSSCASLSVEFQDITFTSDFLNLHHRCCWSRLYLNSSLSSIADTSSDAQQQTDSVRQCCSYVADVAKSFRVKPVVKRTVVFRNTLPGVLRWGDDDTTVYTLSGDVSVILEFDDPWNNACLRGEALCLAPDFLLISPLDCCKRFIFSDSGEACTANASRTQVLALQHLQQTSFSPPTFKAAYTPFKFIVSCTGEQRFVRRATERIVAKRSRGSEGASAPLEMDLKFHLFSVCIPRNDSISEMIETLDFYKPYIAMTETYGVQTVSKAEETQKMEQQYLHTITRRLQKLVAETAEAIRYSNDSKDEDTVTSNLPKRSTTLLGVLKLSKPIPMFFIGSNWCRNSTQGPSQNPSPNHNNKNTEHLSVMCLIPYPCNRVLMLTVVLVQIKEKGFLLANGTLIFFFLCCFSQWQKIPGAKGLKISRRLKQEPDAVHPLLRQLKRQRICTFFVQESNPHAKPFPVIVQRILPCLWREPEKFVHPPLIEVDDDGQEVVIVEVVPPDSGHPRTPKEEDQRAPEEREELASNESHELSPLDQHEDKAVPSSETPIMDGEGAAVEAEKKESTSFGYKQAFSMPVTRYMLITYMVMCGSDSIARECLPLWAISSASKGGLNLGSDKVGFILLMNSLPLFAANFTFSFACAKYGDKMALFRLGVFCAGIAVFFLPLTTYYAAGAFLIFCVLVSTSARQFFCTWSYSLNTLFTARAAPPGKVGAIMGINQSCGAVTRAIIPLMSTPIFAWSISGNNIFPFNHVLVFFISTMGFWYCALRSYEVRSNSASTTLQLVDVNVKEIFLENHFLIITLLYCQQHAASYFIMLIQCCLLLYTSINTGHVIVAVGNQLTFAFCVCCVISREIYIYIYICNLCWPDSSGFTVEFCGHIHSPLCVVKINLGLAAVGVLCGVWTPPVFPAAIVFLTPSVSWVCTLWALGSVSYNFVAFLFVVNALLAVAALQAYRDSFLLLTRILYLPLMACLAFFGLLGMSKEGYLLVGHERLPLPLVIVQVLFQLWSFCSSIVLLLCFPSTLLTAITPQEARENEYNVQERFLVQETQCSVNRIPVSDGCGRRLDTVFVSPREATGRWMIYLRGNCEFVETVLYNVGKMATELEINVIIFNPRGSGRSSGYPLRINDLVMDAATVANFYIDEYRIDVAQFLVMGHSIGGGIAAELARRYLPESPLVVDRSFSSLADAVASVASSLPRKLTVVASTLLIGNLDTISCWDALRHRKKIILFSTADDVIQYHSASIARLPQFQQTGEDASLVLEVSTAPDLSHHNASLWDLNEKEEVQSSGVKLNNQKIWEASESFLTMVCIISAVKHLVFKKSKLHKISLMSLHFFVVVSALLILLFGVFFFMGWSSRSLLFFMFHSIAFRCLYFKLVIRFESALFYTPHAIIEEEMPRRSGLLWIKWIKRQESKMRVSSVEVWQETGTALNPTKKIHINASGSTLRNKLSPSSVSSWINMLFDLLLLVMAIVAHFVGPRVLSPTVSHAAPALGWFCTMTKLWAGSQTFPALIVLTQWIIAYYGYKRLGARCAMVVRLSFLPVLMSCAAALFGGINSGYLSNTLVTLVLLLLQVWSIFGGGVMLACYPATALSAITPQFERDRMREKTLEYLIKASFKVEFPEVKNRTGCKLDTLVILRRQPTERWLLYCGGNAEFLENSISDVHALAENINANAILFNPRGIGRSSGYASQISHLVEDAGCVAEHCITAYSIDTSCLLLFGHSIGGGVVTQLGSKYLQSAPVVVDRSFSSLSDAAVCFSPFAPQMTRQLLPLLVGDLDSLGGWNAISHSNKLIIYSKRDEIIAFPTASIAAQSQFTTGGDRDKVIELQGHTTSSIHWHNSSLSFFDQKQEIYDRMISFFAQTFRTSFSNLSDFKHGTRQEKKKIENLFVVDLFVSYRRSAEAMVVASNLDYSVPIVFRRYIACFLNKIQPEIPSESIVLMEEMGESSSTDGMCESSMEDTKTESSFGFKEAYEMSSTRHMLINAMLISAGDMLYAECFPLWGIAPRSVGGLGLESEAVGLLILANSVPAILANLVFPTVVQWYGNQLRFYQHTELAYAFFSFVVAFGSYFSSSGGFWFAMLMGVIRKWWESWCWCLTAMICAQLAPPGKVSMMYAVQQASMCIVRAVIPFLGAPLFAWSITGDHVFPFNHFLLFVLSAFPLLASCWTTGLLHLPESHQQVDSEPKVEVVIMEEFSMSDGPVECLLTCCLNGWSSISIIAIDALNTFFWDVFLCCCCCWEQDILFVLLVLSGCLLAVNLLLGIWNALAPSYMRNNPIDDDMPYAVTFLLLSPRTPSHLLLLTIPDNSVFPSVAFIFVCLFVVVIIYSFPFTILWEIPFGALLRLAVGYLVPYRPRESNHQARPLVTAFPAAMRGKVGWLVDFIQPKIPEGANDVTIVDTRVSKNDQASGVTETSPTTAAPPPKFGFKQAFQLRLTRDVLVVSMLISASDMIYAETFPLWGIAEISAGGLGLKADSIGVLILNIFIPAEYELGEEPAPCTEENAPQQAPVGFSSRSFLGSHTDGESRDGDLDDDEAEGLANASFSTLATSFAMAMGPGNLQPSVMIGNITGEDTRQEEDEQDPANSVCSRCLFFVLSFFCFPNYCGQFNNVHTNSFFSRNTEKGIFEQAFTITKAETFYFLIWNAKIQLLFVFFIIFIFIFNIFLSLSAGMKVHAFSSSQVVILLISPFVSSPLFFFSFFVDVFGFLRQYIFVELPIVDLSNMLAYQVDYNQDIIAKGLPFNDEAAQYLDEMFKNCVSKSIEELLRERPEDPIPFLANRIRENKKEADLLILKQQKAAELQAAKLQARRRHRSSFTTISTYGASTATVEKLASDEEHETEEKNPWIQPTDGGYCLKFPGGLECSMNTTRAEPLKQIPGINVAKLVCPTIYDLDMALRVMEASAVPNESDGKPTSTVLIIEPPKAPEQVIFVKGIPYSINLIEPLQKEIRSGNHEVPIPENNESFESMALRLVKGHLEYQGFRCDDVLLLHDALQRFVEKRNAEGSDIHLGILPTVQTNYFKTYDLIDKVFFEIMHPRLTQCIQKGKRYSDIPSVRVMPHAEAPTVLFVSFHKLTANLTFSRVIEPFFPYYERLQNIKMDDLRERNQAKKKQFNLKFCQEYWAEVQRRREMRDTRHKSVKQERTNRRLLEDCQFFRVTQAHFHAYATRIQKLFRGYATRKKMKPLVVPRVPAKVLYDQPIPLAVPPLLGLCASRVSAVHGELFGNYASSLLPEPQRVVLHKPRRRLIETDGEASESEEWVQEVIYIPPKRFSRQACHFNPLQRLMEYQRLADCSVLETAMNIQKQCGGLSLLQRKAYDWLKSLSLSVFHIAYLELFHRDKLPFEAMCFSTFMKTFHAEVCGWLSHPHLFSQSTLLSICRKCSSPSLASAEYVQSLEIVKDFTYTTLRKERLLLLGSNTDYVDAKKFSENTSKENLAEMNIRCLGRNIYAVPRLLSEAEWRIALEFVKDAASSPLIMFSENEPLKIYMWFLPESPCVYVYGQGFVYRQRKNFENIEGREKYDEFCTRAVLKYTNSDSACPLYIPPAQVSERVFDPRDRSKSSHIQQEYSSMARILNDYSIFDGETIVKWIILNQLNQTDSLEFLKEDKVSKTFERKVLNKAELDAEALQEERNKKRDQKPPRVYDSDWDETEGTLSPTRSVTPLSPSHHSTEDMATRTLEGSKVLTTQEFFQGLCEEDVILEFIRPRLNFAAQDEFIMRFDRFVEACLHQITEEATIILNFQGDGHLFYCLVVTLLFRGFELANAGTLGDGGSQLPIKVNSFDSFPSQLSDQDMERLSFLEDVYEILRQAMTQNGVDVDECVSSLNSILSETEQYNLPQLISTAIDQAEHEPDGKACRAHILAAVRYSEQFLWLLLLQIYLSLPFTKDSLSKSAINPTPSFSSFFKSVSVREWIETIDPWKKRPSVCPDAYHLRYTNALRRWDSENYICFGAIVDEIFECDILMLRYSVLRAEALTSSLTHSRATKQLTQKNLRRPKQAQLAEQKERWKRKRRNRTADITAKCRVMKETILDTNLSSRDLVMAQLTDRIFSKGHKHIASATNISFVPYGNPSTPLVALAGRSSVGKTSLLRALFRDQKEVGRSNRLLRRDGMNYFNVGSVFNIVDLPGFGGTILSWNHLLRYANLLRNFTRFQPSLKMVYYCMDVSYKHGLYVQDIDMLRFLSQEIPNFTIILTKAEELSDSSRSFFRPQDIREELLLNNIEHPVLITSAYRMGGIDTLRFDMVMNCLHALPTERLRYTEAKRLSERLVSQEELGTVRSLPLIPTELDESKHEWDNTLIEDVGQRADINSKSTFLPQPSGPFNGVSGISTENRSDLDSSGSASLLQDEGSADDIKGSSAYQRLKKRLANEPLLRYVSETSPWRNPFLWPANVIPTKDSKVNVMRCPEDPNNPYLYQAQFVAPRADMCFRKPNVQVRKSSKKGQYEADQPRESLMKEYTIPFFPEIVDANISPSPWMFLPSKEDYYEKSGGRETGLRLASIAKQGMINPLADNPSPPNSLLAKEFHQMGNRRREMFSIFLIALERSSHQNNNINNVVAVSIWISMVFAKPLRCSASVPRSKRACYYFTFLLDSEKKNPKETFFIVSPVDSDTKEDAYLYLCHALLLSKCYNNSRYLHKIYLSLFDRDLSLLEFSKRHADVFELWESIRTKNGCQILYADESSAKKASLKSTSGKSKKADGESKRQGSFEEVVMSNVGSSFEGGSSEAPVVQLNAGRNPSAENELNSLRHELEITKALLNEERKLRAEQEVAHKDEFASVIQQLHQSGHQTSNEMHELVKQNEKVVESIQADFEQRETQLHEMYQEALQARDIRIAQLSNTQLKLQEQQHLSDARLKELERMLSEERKIASQRNFGGFGTDARVHQLEAEQRCFLLERDYRERVAYQAQLESELRSAKLHIISQQSELERASLLLTSLKEGLQFYQNRERDCLAPLTTVDCEHCPLSLISVSKLIMIEEEKIYQVNRLSYCDADRENHISIHKQHLDPFILTDCRDSFPEWKRLGNCSQCLHALDDLLAVECSVTADRLHDQTYFGSEAAGMLRKTPTGGETLCEDTSSFLLPRQRVGGIDIIDNVQYRKRCLSSLRFALLQHHNRDAYSSSDFQYEASDGSPDESSGNRAAVKKLLLWRDAQKIMEYRSTVHARGEAPTEGDRKSLHPLASISGALCFKVAIGHCGQLMDKLEISRLINSNSPFVAVSNPLMLQDSSYCAWAVLSEAHSGTRSHANVMGSHGWHVLLRGKKKWLIVHPLDKYLVTNEDDGSIADLLFPDPVKFPLAQHARIYAVIQEVGESLFLPSDAVYAEVSLEESFGIQVNFVEDTCYPMFEYQTNLNLVLLSSLKFDNGYLQQFTIVDVLLSGPEEDEQPDLLIRGTVWCNDTRSLWTELGARVELAAFHECFESIGDYLLYCRKEPHYAVGLPQGFYLCESDHRLVLHYKSPRETFSLLREALECLTADEELDFRYFTVPHMKAPIHHCFSCTMSQEGFLSSYLPLSVLLNQPWPFEEKLIQTCIALPQVILEKAKHPQGFVRPGSVWHYSNKGSSGAKESDSPIIIHSGECNSACYMELLTCERSSALFYCSPLCRIPITLHPTRDRFTEKKPMMSETNPRINEFAWNMEILEKYGMVELLQFRDPVERVMRDVVCSDPCFSKVRSFLYQHGLSRISTQSLNSESIIASILWILCSPCVTGFTCPAGVQFDSGEFISSSDMYQFQMIGLPSRTASALLVEVRGSPFECILTRVCNWVCDIGGEEDDADVSVLFENIRSFCDVEVAEVLEQIRRIKESLMKCSSGSQVNAKKLNILREFILSLADS
eukprot:gene5316-3818_t